MRGCTPRIQWLCCGERETRSFFLKQKFYSTTCKTISICLSESIHIGKANTDVLYLGYHHRTCKAYDEGYILNIYLKPFILPFLKSIYNFPAILKYSFCYDSEIDFALAALLLFMRNLALIFYISNFISRTSVLWDRGSCILAEIFKIWRNNTYQVLYEEESANCLHNFEAWLVKSKLPDFRVF